VLEWAASASDAPYVFVLVHGFSDLAHAWQPVAQRLAAHGRVVAPDLRGHGDSDWIGGGGYYHFLDYIADLDEVIARCAGGDAAKVVVVGHSMGGSVSAYWAGMRPSKLHALVLIEGLGPPDASHTDVAARMTSWLDAWRGARAKARVMASVDEAAQRLRRYDAMLDDAEARRLAAVGTQALDGGGVVWKLDPLHHTMGPYPFRLDVAQSFWRRVTCPVLCIDGADSRMNLAGDERARRRACFASARDVTVAGAGHAVPRHAPDAVARLIVDHATSAP
jgi:pimeloyl-ACP methyl ester carboxylesterase